MKIRYFLFFMPVILLMSSCYSDNIDMITEAHQSAVYSPDSSVIYFVGYVRAWQAAKGLTAFPDGGKPKDLYKNISLYSYDVKNMRLTRILDCGDLPFNLSRWNEKIVPLNPELSFSISPLQGWDQKMYDEPPMASIKQKFDKIFRITAGGEIIPAISHFPEENIQKANLAILYGYIRALPLASFGLVLKDIYPADEKQLLKDLVSLSNTPMYRRAIIEQIIAGKDQDSIKKIYDKMIASMDKLSGLDRQMVEMREEKNLELLKQMLSP